MKGALPSPPRRLWQRTSPPLKRVLMARFSFGIRHFVDMATNSRLGWYAVTHLMIVSANAHAHLFPSFGSCGTNDICWQIQNASEATRQLPHQRNEKLNVSQSYFNQRSFITPFLIISGFHWLVLVFDFCSVISHKRALSAWRLICCRILRITAKLVRFNSDRVLDSERLLH